MIDWACYDRLLQVDKVGGLMRFFAPSYDISFLFDHFDREVILFLYDNKCFHEIRITVLFQ